FFLPYSASPSRPNERIPASSNTVPLPNLIHDFFKTCRLVLAGQDRRLSPIIYCDVDSTTSEADGSFKVRHSAIQVATVRHVGMAQLSKRFIKLTQFGCY